MKSLNIHYVRTPQSYKRSILSSFIQSYFPFDSRIMFLQLLFLVSLVSSKFVKEEGIVVLNDDNFQKALKNYPLLLVEFYAPVSN